MSNRFQKLLLAIECSFLFGGMPAAYAAGWLPVLIIQLLLSMTIGCCLTLHWYYKVKLRDLLRTSAPGMEWRRIVII